MKNFTFQNTTRIIFGRETENQVGNETKGFSRRILLHYGGGSIKRSGLFDRVVKSLKDAGIEIVELPGVKPNPRLSLVREGIKICREKGVNFIQSISAGVPYNGDVWDFFTGKAKIEKTLPVGVVLTIPAAGSESSDSTVITKEEGLYKRPALSALFRPKFALYSPAVSNCLWCCRYNGTCNGKVFYPGFPCRFN